MQQTTNSNMTSYQRRNLQGLQRSSGNVSTWVPPQKTLAEVTPRIFLLRWNNKHSVATKDERVWSECWGTLYPNGRVSLDYGSAWDSMTDLRAYIAQVGTYTLQWSAEMPPSSHGNDDIPQDLQVLHV